jgi:copper chaperone CopZ
MKNSDNKTFLSAGILAAIASSLCCITPIVALLGGVSGVASVFSFIEPARPYLIGISVLALGYAFYQAYKPKPADDCGCEVDEKKSFLNSKAFLWTITVISIVLYSLPYTNSIFSSNTELNVEQVEQDPATDQYTLSIEGMTCTGCENHVTSALSSLTGVASVRADYTTGSATIVADTTQISFQTMAEVLKDETGYTLTGHQKDQK